MTAVTRHRKDKQERLPKRLSFARTTSSLRQRRKVKKDQSTLTQAWATPSFTSVDEGSEVSDPDFEEPRPRKKRKVQYDLTEEELKQATLTQIGWPFDGNDSDVTEDEEDDSNDETENEEDGNGEGLDESDADMNALDVPPELLDEGHNLEEVTPSGGDSHHWDPLNSPTNNKTSAAKGSSSPPSDRASTHSHPSSSRRKASPRQSPLPVHSPELGRSPGQSTAAVSASFRTPQRPIRREVPSSQSPAITPLSTVSPSPSERTPLRELSFEEWSQRDNTPTPQRRKVLADSEDLSEDKENAVLDTGDDQDYLSSTKSQPRMLFEASPTKDTPKSSRDIWNTDTLAMPPPLLRSHVSCPAPSGPAAFKAQSMPPNSSWPNPASKQHMTKDNDASARSQQDETCDPASLTNQQYDTIRSSQATTVDITQQSPRIPASQPPSSNHSRPFPMSPPQPHAHHSSSQAVKDAHKFAEPFNAYVPQLPPSPPPVFESQFPYSMFSHYSDKDMHIHYGGTEDSQPRHLTIRDFSP